MTLITLGEGQYSVAMTTMPARTPALSFRRLPESIAPGTLLEPNEIPRDVEEYSVLIDVKTPEAAGVLLVIAQHIAFVHGIKP